MIGDLDRIMRARGIDGLVGYGDTTLADPDLSYVAGGMLPRGGFYFKKVGRPSLLVVSTLDYGSAKRLGKVKRVQTLTEWGYEKLLRRQPNSNVASARLVAMILRSEGVRGRTVLFGRNDLAKGLTFARAIRAQGVRLVNDEMPTTLETARDTKGSEEIERLRSVAQRTSKIVNQIITTLRNAKEKRGGLRIGKKRATVGLLKSKIAVAIAENDLVAPEGTIFAAGRDGADPHNMGNPFMEIKKGMLIVFDIFPQAADGYWSDLTRTFMIGRADRAAKKMFNTVAEAQSDALNFVRANVTGDAAMNRVCDVIEGGGYSTIRQVFRGKMKSVTSGLTHSLGHGVGLTIGEHPYLSFGRKNPLREGEVVTVEPGIYRANYGGVRIEDTVLIKSRGIETLTSVEKELELT